MHRFIFQIRLLILSRIPEKEREFFAWQLNLLSSLPVSRSDRIGHWCWHAKEHGDRGRGKGPRIRADDGEPLAPRRRSTDEDDEREGNKPGNHERIDGPAGRRAGCRGECGVRVRRRSCVTSLLPRSSRASLPMQLCYSALLPLRLKIITHLKFKFFSKFFFILTQLL